MNQLKKYFYIMVIYYIVSINSLFAAEDRSMGILGGVEEKTIRSGDFQLSDIPVIIKYAINYIMGFAGTIAVIFIIIGAYQILINPSDKSKGIQTIKYALTGFALASSAWLIIRFVIENFNQ